MQMICMGAGSRPVKGAETDAQVLAVIRYRRSDVPLIGKPGPLQGMPCEIPANEVIPRERMVVLVTNDNGGDKVSAIVLVSGEYLVTYDLSYYIGSGPTVFAIVERERLTPRPDLLELAMKLPDHPFKSMFSESREKLLDAYDRAMSD